MAKPVTRTPPLGTFLVASADDGSSDQHRVAVTEESILFTDRFLISRPDQFIPRERAHHHQ
jgi:hypothetical protein